MRMPEILILIREGKRLRRIVLPLVSRPRRLDVAPLIRGTKRHITLEMNRIAEIMSPPKIDRSSASLRRGIDRLVHGLGVEMFAISAALRSF